MGFKIGLTNINYECAQTLDAAFDAWRQIKGGALKGLIDSVTISSVHCCFPETEKLGYPLQSQDGTIAKLHSLHQEKIIDNLCIYAGAVEEQLAWSDNLQFLGDIDYLFMLNSDECWTVEEIKKLFKFALQHKFIDYFHVNFKNYFGPNKYLKNFVVPRLWNMRNRGGVSSFYRDDLVLFKNGTRDTDAASIKINSHLLFPAHWSWSLPPHCSKEQNEAFCKRKLGFQALRYKTCSYRWNETERQLELNPDYYRMIGQPIPDVYYDEGY